MTYPTASSRVLNIHMDQPPNLTDELPLEGAHNPDYETLVQQLRKVATISQKIGQIHEPDKLLNETIALIQSSFSLYHVHIYLYDEAEAMLRGHIGSGAIGEQLLKQAHKIPLQAQKSLIALSARKQKMVLVQDVHSDANFLANPLLPKTHSELVIPLQYGRSLLGILDIQDSHPNRFGPIELDTFLTLAGHVAIALQNARLFSERDQIEVTLRERTHTLEARNEELAQFAYVASHDLQEPLRMITSYLQLLEQRYKGQLDKEADEFIDYAVDGANRLRQLITDLLAYSRVSRRTQPFTLVELDKVLQQAQHNLELRIQETSTIITHDPLPTLLADKTQMLQLLQNLLSNAIKFRKQDGPIIHISARQEETSWIIQVADNGIGMEPKLTKKIFAIFQRLHTNQEYPGTGIGLAICKKIIQNHKGTIWVETEPGVGSTFFFSLPTNAS